MTTNATAPIAPLEKPIATDPSRVFPPQAQQPLTRLPIDEPPHATWELEFEHRLDLCQQRTQRQSTLRRAMKRGLLMVALASLEMVGRLDK